METSTRRREAGALMYPAIAHFNHLINLSFDVRDIDAALQIQVDHITSHHIISHHITSHNITSHQIKSRRTTSNQITSHHTKHHTISTPLFSWFPNVIYTHSQTHSPTLIDSLTHSLYSSVKIQSLNLGASSRTPTIHLQVITFFSPWLDYP